MVDAKGLHGLSCKRSAPRQIRHTQMNDIIWRSVKKAQYPAVKEVVGLSRSDGKRPDGATMIPWTRGKPLAWGVTIPDTFANSYICETSTRATAAADRAEERKRQSTPIWPRRTISCQSQLRQVVPGMTIWPCWKRPFFKVELLTRPSERKLRNWREQLID